MQIEMWNFDKRLNSTATPSSEGVTVDFFYKDRTDLHNPMISLSSNPLQFNYGKIGNLYFFFERVEATPNGIWYVSLTIDLLASFKADIMNTTAYVLRAATNYNSLLYDELNRIESSASRTVLVAERETQYYDANEGCFILEVSNSVSTTNVKTGFNAAYILTAQQMTEIANMLMTNQDIINELIKAFQSPIDSVISCQWIPLDYNNLCAQTGGRASHVYLGAYDTGLTAFIVGDNFISFTDSFDLSSFKTGDYRMDSRITEISVNVPLTGTVILDSQDILETSASAILNVRVCIDVRAGKQLTLFTTNDYNHAPFQSVETIISSKRQVSSSSTDYQSALMNIPKLISLAATDNWLGAGSLALQSSYNASKNTVNAVGSSGGSSAIGHGVNTRCVITRKDLSFLPNDYNARISKGLPCNKSLPLSQFTGYVQTLDASVSSTCYMSEKQTLNNFLNGGIYIE